MKVLDSLLQKEVTRTEFLKLSGFGMASLFGFGTIVKLLTGKNVEHHLTKAAGDYSVGDYGGKTAAAKHLG